MIPRAAAWIAFLLAAAAPASAEERLQGLVAAVDADRKSFLVTTRNESGHFEDRKLLWRHGSGSKEIASLTQLKRGMWVAVEAAAATGDDAAPGTSVARQISLIPPLDAPSAG